MVVKEVVHSNRTFAVRPSYGLLVGTVYVPCNTTVRDLHVLISKDWGIPDDVYARVNGKGLFPWVYLNEGDTIEFTRNP